MLDFNPPFFKYIWNFIQMIYVCILLLVLTTNITVKLKEEFELLVIQGRKMLAISGHSGERHLHKNSTCVF